MLPTPNKIWKDKGYQNTPNFSHNRSFFIKTELQQLLVNDFILLSKNSKLFFKTE